MKDPNFSTTDFQDLSDLVLAHREHILNYSSRSPLSLLGRKYLEKVPKRIERNKVYRWLLSTQQYQEALNTLSSIKAVDDYQHTRGFIDLLWGITYCLTLTKSSEETGIKPTVATKSNKDQALKKASDILELIKNHGIKLYSISDHHLLKLSLARLNAQLIKDRKKGYPSKFAAEAEGITALAHSIAAIQNIKDSQIIDIAIHISGLFSNQTSKKETPSEKSVQRWVRQSLSRIRQ